MARIYFGEDVAYETGGMVIEVFERHFGISSWQVPAIHRDTRCVVAAPIPIFSTRGIDIQIIL